MKRKKTYIIKELILNTFGKMFNVSGLLIFTCHVGHHGIQDPGVHWGRGLSVKVKGPDVVVGLGLRGQGSNPDLPENPETGCHKTFSFTSYHFHNLFLFYKFTIVNFFLRYFSFT